MGLRLFWSWVDPGATAAHQALAAEGRAAIGVVLGLAVVLLVSGVIEAFVTPSGLPTWARIAIGVLAELASSPTSSSPAAARARRGVTGDVAVSLREAEVATAG